MVGREVTEGERSVTGQVTLLIISDELDSATRRDHDAIVKHTSKHFAQFMQLLSNPLMKEEMSILVKNVGDSLMIRAEIQKPSEQIPKLLKEIIKIQKELTKNGISVRALVALCDDFVAGEEIYSQWNGALLMLGIDPQNSELNNKLPSKRFHDGSWLHGDLFGTAVARAFRASGIPKGPELVVEDSVAQRVEKGLSNRGANVDELHFGPRVAFSPIKGMTDLYNVREKPMPKPKEATAKDEKSYPGHIWLRTVSLKNEKVDEDPLVKRQELFRVCTELILSEDEKKDKCVRHWVKVLAHIENEAGYFRLKGNVRKIVCWSSKEPTTKKPNPSLIKEPNGSGAGPRLVVLGAYPEFDTYFNARTALFNNQEKVANTEPLRYALTHLLWEPTSTREKVAWSRIASYKRFIVILARDIEEMRTDKRISSSTGYIATQALKPQLTGFDLCDCAFVVGEWDFFALFGSRTDSSAMKWGKLADKCKFAYRKMQRLRFLGCDAC